MSRIQQVIDTLEAERAELQERLAWLEEQIEEFHAHQDGQRRQRQLARRVALPLGERALVVRPRAPARLTPRPSDIVRQRNAIGPGFDETEA